MASAQHFSHRFDRVSVGDGSQAGDKVVDGFPVIGQKADAVEGKIARVSNERGRVVVLLDVFLKGGLGFSWPHRIVVAWEHEAFYPFRKQFQQAGELGVLSEQIRNGEFLVLSRINPDTVDAISRENEVLDRLR